MTGTLEYFLAVPSPMVRKPCDLNSLNGLDGTNNKICLFSEIDDNNFNWLI